MPKFEQDNHPKLVDGCCTSFEFLLRKHISILFGSTDTLCRNLTKNALLIFKLDKTHLNNGFLVAPNMVIGQKTNYNFFLGYTLCAQITFPCFL